MAAKLTFNDIENNELDPSKLSFTVGITNAVSTGFVNPSLDAVVGAIYSNTASGDLFRKITPGATQASWQKISSITTTILQNRYRTITNAAVTSTDSTAPSVGDLVGYWGAGAWSTSGTLSAVKERPGSAGVQTAALIAGGSSNLAGNFINTTEVFNGSAWSTSGNLNVAKYNVAGAGAQNAALMAGGNTNVTTVGMIINTELFNTSTWTNGNNISQAKQSMGSSGAQNAALITGGDTGTGNTPLLTTELFNGSTWSLSSNTLIARSASANCGSQNAALMAGGFSGAGSVPTSTVELFNGSTWFFTGTLSISKGASSGMGSQIASLVAGGATGGAATNVSELFNGSTWIASGVLSAAKSVSGRAGSQSAGLVAGGNAGGFTNVTELHSQTTFRKIHTKNLPDAKNIGILSSTATVLLQGTNTSVTYPANKYLILNRSANAAITNYNNLSSLAFSSILGSAPTMTYNLSTTTNLLSVVPGMVAIVVSSGGNPVSTNNVGSFIISRVISPSSFEIQNSAGTSQNPGTGTVSILTSLLAVDNYSPQDIVIGKTDSSGLLTLSKPLITGSLIQRLK